MTKQTGKLIRVRAFTDELIEDPDVPDSAWPHSKMAAKFAHGQRAQGYSARIYERVITADRIRMDVMVVVVREKGQTNA